MTSSSLGESVRAFRKHTKLNGASFAKQLDISTATLNRIERGIAPLGGEQRDRLRKMGWSPPSADDVEASGDVSTNSKADDAAKCVQELLDTGRPLADVYDHAQRALAGFLTGGLSSDRKRAWDTLLRTLRDSIAERGRTPPLVEHPDWPKVREALIDALEPYPDAMRAVQEKMSEVEG